MSSQRKKEKAYEQSTLERALRMIKAQQISLSQASIQFNIPKGTLHNKIHGKTALHCKKGPSKLLTDDEEHKIATWILNMAKIGYPVNADDVRETVAKIFEIKGTHLKPGKKWMKLFLQRHPNITKRHAEIISKARALVTEPMIRKWFESLYQHLQEENADDILACPERIFNLDETGVQLCPKTGVILAPKNYRAMYNVACGQEKQSITVLCNFSADGGIVPPFVVYPLQRISKEVAQSVPDDWAIGRSESGWMTGETFFQYITEIFLPWLQKNNVLFPVLLLVDGHKSHINLQLHEFCVQNKIILYCLHPNTTHILQPCDVGIFGPLKAMWKTTARKHKNKENTQITKANFAKLFAQSFDMSMKKTIIVNAFKACGIFPFNADAVDYSKCISNRTKLIEESEQNISINDYKTTIDVIEKMLNKNVLVKYEEYRRCDKECKSSLFKFWKKCKNRVDNILLSQSSNIEDSAINSLRTDNSNIEKNARDTERILKTHERVEQRQERELTLGTSTFDQGMMDIENMPIEIEGVTFLLDGILEDTHEDLVTPSIQSTGKPSDFKKRDVTELMIVPQSQTTNVFDLTNTSIPVNLAAPQTTSTPVSSKSAIPLPWYTNGKSIQDMSLQIDIPSSQNTPQVLDVDSFIENLSLDMPNNPDESKNANDQFTKTQHNRDVTLDHTEPGCSKVITSKIDELLKLPERKTSTKRKQSKSPVPLAITSKKFKEYLEQKESEKKKKAEDIINRKIQRERKKAEKQEQMKDKKIKRKKTSNTIKPKACAAPVDETTTPSKTPFTQETENTNEENESLTMNNDNNICFGDYVIIEFETNKRNRYYVGQVLKIDYENNYYKVKCFRKKASKFDNSIYFIEPSTADLTEVSNSAIKHVLPAPQTGRRGMITFKNSPFDIMMCE